MPPLPPPQLPKPKRGLIIGLGLAVVVLLALVIALAFAKDDKTVTAGSSDEAAGPPTTVEGGVVPAETQPVTVTGDALPPLPDAGADDEALGQQGPALVGYTFNGAPIAIEPGSSPKLLVFLAHWCPHCNREIPRLLEWKAAGRVPEGLEIIGITTAVDDKAANYPPSKWIQDKQWEWPVLADSEDQAAASAYGLTGFPYFVVLGADGTVKVRFSGEIEVDQLDGLVRNALTSG